MKHLFSILFFALFISFTFALDSSHSFQTQTTINQIIRSIAANGNTKEIFKVWHSVYRPSYEVNTLEGISRYKIFKSNLKAIVEHNKKNLSWKAGINNYTDMTSAELEIYFNVKEISAKLYRKKMRGLLSLDDYDDSLENSSDPDPPQNPNLQGKKVAVDWSNKMNPIRNQGGCGSCWAFSVAGAVEGNYAVSKGSSPVLSTQQLVDCDYDPNNGGNWGCSGGWMRHANSYWQTQGIMEESVYPYTAVLGTCKFDVCKLSKVKVTGMETTADHDVGMFGLLVNGPLSVCVNVQSSFQSYRSGIYSATCSSGCNHAVLLVGCKAAVQEIIG